IAGQGAVIAGPKVHHAAFVVHEVHAGGVEGRKEVVAVESAVCFQHQTRLLRHIDELGKGRRNTECDCCNKKYPCSHFDPLHPYSRPRFASTNCRMRRWASSDFIKVQKFSSSTRSASFSGMSQVSFTVFLMSASERGGSAARRFASFSASSM